MHASTHLVFYCLRVPAEACTTQEDQTGRMHDVFAVLLVSSMVHLLLSNQDQIKFTSKQIASFWRCTPRQHNIDMTRRVTGEILLFEAVRCPA